MKRKPAKSKPAKVKPVTMPIPAEPAEMMQLAAAIEKNQPATIPLLEWTGDKLPLSKKRANVLKLLCAALAAVPE